LGVLFSIFKKKATGYARKLIEENPVDLTRIALECRLLQF